jgi:chromate reductase
MQVLAISGSLRRASSNAELLRAVARLAPPDMAIAEYQGLASLPPFNPDQEFDPIPSVEAWRQALTMADAVLVSSPEYAHGVPGSLKNAFDWVVGSGELIDKPIAIMSASSRSTFAHESLRETLTTMNGKVVREASVTLPVSGRGLDAAAIAGDPEIANAITSALHALKQAVETKD